MLAVCENRAIDLFAADEVRFYIQSQLLHGGRQLLRLGKWTGCVVAAVNDKEPTGVPETAHDAEMFRAGGKSQLLSVGSEKEWAGRIAVVAGIENAAAGKIEGHVVGKLLHAGQIDDAGEGARREFVAHQHHVAAARSTGRKYPPAVEIRSTRP